MKGTNKRIQAVDLKNLVETNHLGLILTTTTMPIERVLVDETQVDVILRNGTTKTFKTWTKIEVVVGKAKHQVVERTVSGKTLSDKKKAEKAARDRALRLAMKGRKA